MNIRRILALGLLMVAGVSFTRFATASQPENCTPNNRLVVATIENNRPFEFKDANGNLIGFEIDVVRRVAQELGLNVTFQVLEDQDAVLDAVRNRTNGVVAGIANLQIPDPLPTDLAYVQIAGTGEDAIGIAINPACCQLYVNIRNIIQNVLASSFIPTLANRFNNTTPPPSTSIPTPFTFVDRTPAACAATQPVVPTRNCLGTYLFSLCAVNPNTVPVGP